MNNPILNKILNAGTLLRPCVLPVAAMLGLAGSAWASQTINVKFGNSGTPADAMNGKSFITNNYQQAPAAYTGTTWNDSFRIDDTNITPITVAGLLDSDGNTTGVGYTTLMSDNPNYLFGPRVMGNEPNVTLLNSGLYRVFNSGSGNATHNRFIVSGLDVTKTYHIYLACSADLALNNRWGIGTASAAPSSTKDILNTAVTKAAGTWAPGDNWLVFYNVAPQADGKIYVWGYNLNGNSTNSGLTLNGFQVVDATDWLNSDKSLYNFTVPGTPSYPGVISNHNTGNTITVTMPASTKPWNDIAPSFTLADGASCNPPSISGQDFSAGPVDYTVTAQDGSTRVYHVSVALSSAKDILTYSVGGNPAVISGTNVSLVVPYGNSVTELSPTIEVSPLATVFPDTGVAQDFSSPVSYTVTAEDGSQKVYSVTVYLGAAPGTIDTAPPGLPPGTQYRLVFVTSGKTYARTNAGGGTGPTSINDFNTFATSAATSVGSLAGLSSTWKAVVSVRNANGSTVSAKSNTGTDVGTGVPIFNLAGQLVASSNSTLWANSALASPINVTELGTSPPLNNNNHALVHTGMNDDGSANGDWSLCYPTGGYAFAGDPTTTAVNWANNGVTSWCSQLGSDDPNAYSYWQMPIYVMSGILTVPQLLSPACDMVAFNWGSYAGAINQTDHTIVVHIPFGTAVNPLNPNPTFAVSPLATCDKTSGGTGLYDFTLPHVYQVTAAAGNSESYTVTIVPDVPTVTLSLTGSPLSEDGGMATITATLSNTCSQDVTVNLTFSGTAALGSQYTRDASSITILAGQTTGEITLTGVQDNFYGQDRIALADISTVTHGLVGTPSQVTATITNTTPMPPGLPVPTGLNPGTGKLWAVGDTYHLAFVTSTTRDATDPNISTFNAFVNTAAGLSTLTDINHIPWSVIGSSQNDAITDPARLNAPVSGPVYLVDGTTMVAAGYADIWDGTLAHGIDKDQNGTSVAVGTAVWTGTVNANGTPANYPTGPFYRSFGSSVGYTQWGKVGATDPQWITAGENPSGNGYRFYALSVPLTCTIDSPAIEPLPPTITGITPGNGSLTVAFTAGYDGGSAITNYRVSTDDGGTWTTASPAVTTSPIVISGLDNGTAYPVRILAVSSLGDSTPSAAVSGIPSLPSSACDMLAFGPGADITGTNIVLFMPQGTTNEQVAAIAPTFTLSPYATCNQPNGVTSPIPPLNSTATVPYVVTAQDGFTTKTYQVTVVVLTMPNDNFVDAIALAGGSGISHRGVANATLEVGEPNTYGYYANTVWFKWTAPSNGTFHLSTVGTLSADGAPWDATIDIYDGGPAIGALHSLLTADNDQAETVEQAVTAGSTYTIRIGYGGGNGPATNANGLKLTWSFVGTGISFGDWCSINSVTGQPNEDSNGDGVQNGVAYFMNAIGRATNPGLAPDNTLTWPMNDSFVGTYEVQTSTDLNQWVPVNPQPTRNAQGNVVYQLNPNAGKIFVRLVVIPN